MKVQKILLSATCLLLLTGCTTPPFDENIPTSAAPTEPAQVSPVATPSTAPEENAPTEKPTPTATPVPKFSKEGGFYDKAFHLTLSAAPGSTIYYTTDGSDPRNSESALRYTNEILIYDRTIEPNVYSAITDITLNNYNPPAYNIDKGFPVRAVVKATDGTYGPVVTNSYFIGKTASYYTDLRVISLVTEADYLFHPDTGVYMVGSKYYDWKNSDDYVAYDPSDVQNPTNYNSDGKESEFPVTIQVFENGSSVFTSDVGARISGNWSRSSAQKSIRLYARKELSGETKMKYAFIDGLTNSKGNELKKYDKVTLRNGGNDSQLHFRDAFIQDLAKDLAVDIMASEPYILFINGEFWGFYMLREKPEDYYIQSHYGIDEKNVTVIKNGSLDSGEWENLEEYRDFCRWASSTDMTWEPNYQKFCEQMDVQSFMDYMAIETYVNNSDWATGYMNNWMVWRSEVKDASLKKADGKWRFILYDMDISAGIWGNDVNSVYYDSLGTIGSEWSDFNLPAMLKNLCKNEKFKEAFYQNYLSVIDNVFAYDKVEAKLNEYTSLCGEATKATQYRFGDGWAADGYDNNAKSLLRFFKVRPEYAKKYLDIYCGFREADSGVTLTETRHLPPSKWWYWGGAEFRVDYEKEEFHAHVSELPPNIWEAQAGVSGLSLEEGYRYQVSFDASCTGTGDFQVIVNRFDGSGYPTITVAGLTLTKELSHYDCTFLHTLESNADWSLCFNFGGSTGDFVIKNVSISKVE